MWTFWDHKRLWSKKSTPRVLGSFPLSAIFKKQDRGSVPSISWEVLASGHRVTAGNITFLMGWTRVTEFIGSVYHAVKISYIIFQNIIIVIHFPLMSQLCWVNVSSTEVLSTWVLQSWCLLNAVHFALENKSTNLIFLFDQ